MTRITIEVTEEQKHKMKVLASLNNQTLKDFILDNTIEGEPNEETLKAFKEIKGGKGTTCTIEDFKKELELLND